MKKTNLILVLFIFFFESAKCQPTAFSRHYDVSPINSGLGLVRMENAYNGGFVISCSSYAGFDTIVNQNIYVIRIDNYGDTVWTRTLGTNYPDEITSIKKTIDGNYLLAGTTNNPNLLSLAEDGVLLIKIDTAGNTLWTTTIDVGWAYGSVSDLFTLNDGSYIVTGSSLLSAGYEAAFMMKVHNSGSQLWTQFYSNFIWDETLIKAEKDSSNNFYIAGVYYDPSFNMKFKMIKVDVFGNLVWTRNYSLGTQFNYAFDPFIMNDFNEGMYFSGYDFDDSSSTGYGVIFRTNTSGIKIWQKLYANTSLTYLVPGNDSMIFSISGRKIVKLNSLGDTLYTFLVPISFFDADFSSILKTNDGGFLFGGRAFVVSTTQPVELFLYKSDTLNIATGIVINIPEATNNFNIYPNPASNKLIIKSVNPFEKLEISNVFGKKIFEQKINAETSEMSVNISSINPGIYFIRMVSETGSNSKKFIKL